MWKLRHRARESLAQSHTASGAGHLGQPQTYALVVGLWGVGGLGPGDSSGCLRKLQEGNRRPFVSGGRTTPSPLRQLISPSLLPGLLPKFHPAPSSVFSTLETLTCPLLFVLANVGSDSTVETFLQGQTAGQRESIMDSSKLDTVQI